MNYTLHQLQVFAKVVQTKSITKAAEELYMSQPAVSIQLKNLQDQFEIPLTEVIGRQLYITDFGKEIYGMAERIINEVYAINYKTMSYKGFNRKACYFCCFDGKICYAVFFERVSERKRRH